MSKQEMLELAARASGVEVWSPRMNGGRNEDGSRIILTPCHTEVEGEVVEWNPIDNDGDALRLAVKLGLQVFTDYKSGIDLQPGTGVLIGSELPPEFWLAHNDDPCAATRLAIVRAAAEIGKGMK
jgi:hypothetical protein